ncbi:hypothetical protein BH10BAC4_BH10BAC4_23400 [soil metagenome]
MKSVSLVCCVILTLCILSDANAQGTAKTYLNFSYTKLAPGKRETYLHLIHNYSPKITAERIRTGGGLLGWYMYEVRMPSGASNDHDFVSITNVSDFNLLFDEMNPPAGTMEKLFPGISSQTINGVFETYESSRTVLKKELFRPLFETSPMAKPSKIVWVDYIKAEPGFEKEAESFMPFYKELMSKGLISGCKVYKKMMPVGPSADFDFVVAYFAEDIASVADGRLSEAVKKSASSKSSGTKTMFSELWQLVEYVDVEKSKQ